MTAPASVSTVYSEANMQLSLVTAANADSPCNGAECELNRAFDQRVLRLGTDLAQAAFATYPDLTRRLGRFEFVIAEKADPGSVSSAAGTVVIFRGVQKLRLDEDTLGFLIAREMGHVIGRHHEENAATGIWFSVLAAVFMPVTSIISGSAAVAQTTASASAASSAASFIGSRITIASYKQDQLHEADAIAMKLLDGLGWSRKDVADALIANSRVLGDDGWSKDMRASAEDVAGMVIEHNSITGLNVGNAGDGKTLITVGLAQPLADLPAGFTTDDPPRIILDFPNTTNGLGISAQAFFGGDLLGANIVQSGGRTRLAINLNRMLSYSTRIEGNNLLIALQDEAGDNAAADGMLRFARADSRLGQ
ncbi:MAG: hypothetical protein A2Z95_04075 [Gallionellales bacterium GWA2_60_18]|nr:MAG: hypothetical protein A2Z95_04075 [Gallionellales bacterium GWA2_60_18]